MGDGAVADTVADVIWIRRTPRYLTAASSVVSKQLLAYHIAVLRGADVD